MALNIALTFNTSCGEALEFYGKVFNSEPMNVHTYGDIPEADLEQMPEEHRHKIMYSELKIHDQVIMLWDDLLEYDVEPGNRIIMQLSFQDKGEFERIYNALSEDGVVEMEPQATFFNPYYAEVTDPFGVNWMLSLEGEREEEPIE